MVTHTHGGRVLLLDNVRLQGWEWVQDREIAYQVTKRVLKQH